MRIEFSFTFFGKYNFGLFFMIPYVALSTDLVFFYDDFFYFIVSI